MRTLGKCPENFIPCQRAIELLYKKGISNGFIDECIPDFIFYWTFTKKGTVRKDWQTSFINWVKKGWSYKKEKEKSTNGCRPASFTECNMPKIKKSRSTLTLKDRLRGVE